MLNKRYVILILAGFSLACQQDEFSPQYPMIGSTPAFKYYERFTVKKQEVTDPQSSEVKANYFFLENDLESPLFVQKQKDGDMSVDLTLMLEKNRFYTAKYVESICSPSCEVTGEKLLKGRWYSGKDAELVVVGIGTAKPVRLADGRTGLKLKFSQNLRRAKILDKELNLRYRAFEVTPKQYLKIGQRS